MRPSIHEWVFVVFGLFSIGFLGRANAEEATGKPLFNGKDLSGWRLRDPKAEMTWKVVSSVGVDPKGSKRLIGEGNGGTAEGVLLRLDVAKGTDLVSEEKFKDCEVHVEFLNAKDSNSGVFLMGQYEVQISDSFGVPEKKLAAGECGGILWLKAPMTNACKKPGEWQTCDISFRAPRFKDGKKIENAKILNVVLNGKKVQENVDVPEPTGGELEGGEVAEGPILLQGNEGVVAFRNVRVKANGGK